MVTLYYISTHSAFGFEGLIALLATKLAAALTDASPWSRHKSRFIRLIFQ